MKDGGSAFPVDPGSAICHEGISKLDFFAAAAPIGLLSGLRELPDEGDHEKLRSTFAAVSYRLAASMLAERERLKREP